MESYLDIKTPTLIGKFKINRKGELISLTCGVKQLDGSVVVGLRKTPRPKKWGWRNKRKDPVLHYGKKSYSIARLVAETFIPNPENKPCVNHIDNNPQNNSVENLEWVTYSENTQHALKQGRQIIPDNRGEKQGGSKLKEHQVIAILQNMEFLSKKQLAEKYGVKYDTIRAIVNRKNWKHIKYI